MTDSEARLWACIQRSQLGARFRRQVPIGPWIVDFASFNPRIVIEVDDRSHYWRDEEERGRYLRSCGFEILRFDNRDVALAIDGVVRSIRTAVVCLQAGLPLPWAET